MGMSLQIVPTVPTVERRCLTADALNVVALYNAKSIAMQSIFKVLGPDWILVVEKRADIETERKALRLARMQVAVGKWR